MSTNTDAPNLSPEESAEVNKLLTELHACGYRDVAEHGKLRPGVRIRHTGHRWPGAYDNGSGVVVAITEKPNSSWSASWGAPDVELIAVWDKPSLGGRVSQLAQYHVVVSPG